MATERSLITSEVDFDKDGRQTGFLRLPHSVHRSAYGWIPIPIISIKNGDGPTILLMAGNHGDEYEGQVALSKLCRALAPDRDIPHIQLTAAYSGIGRMEEARAAAAKVLRIDPKFSVSGWKRAHADYKDQATIKKLANLLTKAGLPE